MAMTNIAEALNNVPDPATRDALFRAFAALKGVFDAHTHQCAAADAYSSRELAISEINSRLLLNFASCFVSCSIAST